MFEHLRGARGVVLAVSGGPDSIALMHLAAAWQTSVPVPLWVATVDHRLRSESAAEAADVARAAEAIGLPAKVLPWEGVKPTRALQEKARAARYALLGDFAAAAGASHVATAHTLDDQAETLLLRMAGGSGLRGLGGMRPISRLAGTVLARPFLGVSKVSLVTICEANNWSFVRDPANQDPRFARSRWRRLAPMLAAEGLTADRLGALSERLARADDALHDVAADVMSRCRIEAPSESLRLDGQALLGHRDELVIRVLAQALTEIANGGWMRLNRLETLVSALRESSRAGQIMRRTLHGCLLDLDRGGMLTIRREPPRRRGTANVL